MNRHAIGVHPLTNGALEWLSESFNCISIEAFRYWHSMETLREIGDEYVCGRMNQLTAQNLLKTANQKCGTEYTLGEVLGLDGDAMYPEMFTSRNDVGLVFYDGENSDMFEFFTCAVFSDHYLDALLTGGRILNTVIVVTFDGLDGLLMEHFPGPLLLVCRSTRTKFCESKGTIGDFYTISDATSPGDTETYALPKGIYGLIETQRRSIW